MEHFFPDLGILSRTPSFSDAFFLSESLFPSERFYPIDLGTAVQKALFYLEASLSYPDATDRELLFCLACMDLIQPDMRK